MMTEATTLQPEAQHQRFGTTATAYLGNLSKKEREAETFAVTYSRSELSWIFPTLIVSNMVEDPKAVAEKVARILNAHWDDEA